MRRTLIIVVTALALAPAAAHASLRGEIEAVVDTAAIQWAGMVTAGDEFANPFPADLARGHGPFVPPGLAYAIHAAGLRRGDAKLVATAERVWPNVVAPERASAFDVLAAARAYRRLPFDADRRTQLADYLGRYGVPVNGSLCITRPSCYNNLKLVDATAVLAVTGAGIAAGDPAARLADPRAARAAARAIVNRRVGQVVDHGLRGRRAGRPVRGTILSDPPSDPLAYHALSTFMLGEAVAELGPRSSASARRARRETLEALALLVAPDGDASYLGRGQGQVWVPAVTAAALIAGARDRPRHARRYLGAARAAVRRLARLHGTAGTGLALVPGARTTTAGIDAYAHTVAYNGLALFALTAALDALGPAARPGAAPGTRRLAVADPDASGLAVVARPGAWMAVHRTPRNRGDLRHDFGLLALKQQGSDLLAPRPLTYATADSAGPALVREGVPITPTGTGITARGDTVTITGGYRRRGRWLRRMTFAYRLTREGATLTTSGARRGDRFRVLAFTPAGSGTPAPRGFTAAGARWRFDRPFTLLRRPGFHSGPVERLDALEAVLVAPRSGRFTIRIGTDVRNGRPGARVFHSRHARADDHTAARLVP